MTLFSWTEIESFHNIRKFVKSHPEILQGNSVVEYSCKTKLHGTNSAIQSYTDGQVVVQSRTAIITPQSDNVGFAKWVEDRQQYWTNLYDQDIIVYGEFVGKGIQKGVAVNEIPNKSFAVFAAKLINDPESLIIEPEELSRIVKDIPDTYVLPWEIVPIQIDWSSSAEALTEKTNTINEWVERVEKCDPWVARTFDIRGTGEGLVFYPVSKEHLGLTNYNNLTFKAKGEAHKNIQTAKPAQVDAQKANSIAAFVEMVLTPARLDQGLTTVGGADPKATGKFIAWCVADVKKETQDELSASSLTWKEVEKHLSDTSRNWFLNKCKEL